VIDLVHSKARHTPTPSLRRFSFSLREQVVENLIIVGAQVASWTTVAHATVLPVQFFVVGEHVVVVG
jgi:hypothetical protein